MSKSLYLENKKKSNVNFNRGNPKNSWRWKSKLAAMRATVNNWSIQAQVAIEIATKREAIYANCE